MYEIYIDYDSKNLKEFFENFEKQSNLLKNLLKIEVKEVRIFETVNGYHIYIKLKIPYKLKTRELFLLLNSLELIFSSDKKRAIFNIVRILHLKTSNYKNISVLFKDTELREIFFILDTNFRITIP